MTASAALIGWEVASKRVAVRHSSTHSDEFKRKIRGGIVVLPTPFTADFKVDFEGLRKIIRGALAQGFQVYELTAGDGRIWFLSPEELRQVARTIVETVGDKGVTTICGHTLWTNPIIDFARDLESIGASALQLVLPNYGDEDSKEVFREYCKKHPSVPGVARQLTNTAALAIDEDRYHCGHEA